MNLNFFINNLKHVEKLNKTNIKFIEYNNNFVKYLNNNNSVLELFKNLGSDDLDEINEIIDYLLSKIFTNPGVDQREVVYKIKSLTEAKEIIGKVSDACKNFYITYNMIKKMDKRGQEKLQNRPLYQYKTSELTG